MSPRRTLRSWVAVWVTWAEGWVQCRGCRLSAGGTREDDSMSVSPVTEENGVVSDCFPNNDRISEACIPLGCWPCRLRAGRPAPAVGAAARRPPGLGSGLACVQVGPGLRRRKPARALWMAGAVVPTLFRALVQSHQLINSSAGGGAGSECFWRRS